MIHNPKKDVASKGKMRGFSSRDQHSLERLVTPRESTASTSLSIHSNYKRPKFAEGDEYILEKHMSKLQLANTYLTPVVDEILSIATSYSQMEFERIMSSKSPICSISLCQYIDALKASEIFSEFSQTLRLSETEINTYLMPEVVVNTMFSFAKKEKKIAETQDKVYVDKELLKQLVDLHEMIIETIRQLKDVVPGRLINKHHEVSDNTESSNFYTRPPPKELEPVKKKRGKDSDFYDDKKKGPNEDTTSAFSSKTTLSTTPPKEDAVVTRKTLEEDFIILDFPGKKKEAPIVRTETPSRPNSEASPSTGPPPMVAKDTPEEMLIRQELYESETATISESPETKKGILTTLTVAKHSRVAVDSKSRGVAEITALVPTLSDLRPLESTEEADESVADEQEVSPNWTVAQHPSFTPNRKAMGVSEEVDNVVIKPRYTEMDITDFEDDILMKEDKSEMISQISEGEILERMPYKPAMTKRRSCIKKSCPTQSTFGCYDDLMIKNIPADINTNNTTVPPKNVFPEKGTKEILQCRSELDKLKKMFCELSAAVDVIRNRDKAVDKSIIPAKFGTQTGCSTAYNEASVSTKQRILDCITELGQIKELMAKMDKPELTVDTAPGESKSCCSLVQQPHIHAKLNGIPVTVKLNQSTVNILLNEKDPFRKRHLCACHTEKTMNAIKKQKRDKMTMNSIDNEDVYTEVSSKFLDKNQNANEKNLLPTNKGRKVTNNKFENQDRVIQRQDTTTPLPHQYNISREVMLTKYNSLPYAVVIKPHEENEKRIKSPTTNANRLSNKLLKHFEPLHENFIVDSGYSTDERKSTQHKFETKGYPSYNVDVKQGGAFEKGKKRAPSISIDSASSLPYTVHKKSLPNINICPAMKVAVSQLKERMRPDEVTHPNQRICKQLTAIGVDNLIKASIPAECCRRAVINEVEVEEEPFHASINSLPLTTSDMQIIAEVTGREEQCTGAYGQQTFQSLEYYTNFQENLASNIAHYMPTRVYEVRFFEIFKRNDKKVEDEAAPKVKAGGRISEILRKFIYNESPPQENTKTNDKKIMRNKKCQTDGTGACCNNQKSLVEKRECKASKNKSKQKSRKIQCSISDGFAQSRQQITNSGDSTNKSIGKFDQSPEITAAVSRLQNQVNSCSTNLGTIYENDERNTPKSSRRLDDRKKQPLTSPSAGSFERMERNFELFYDFLKTPDLSPSFQSFVTSDAAIRAFDANDFDVEKFFGLYLDAKKAKKEMCSTREVTAGISDRTISTMPQKKTGKGRRCTVSRIPKRIKKHSFSESSSDMSVLPRHKKQKVRSRSTVAIKDADGEASANRIDEDGKLNEKATKVVLTKYVDDYEAEFNSCSIESLQMLASRNGPGYVSVLHPICGCPEVSIFIPCYCEDERHRILGCKQLSTATVQRLLSSKGRHVILSKTCRVEKSGEGAKDNVDAAGKG